jgi:hypothetical protein
MVYIHIYSTILLTGKKFSRNRYLFEYVYNKGLGKIRQKVHEVVFKVYRYS